MKAKLFKEFILESTEPNTDTEEGIRWWFGPESNMQEILGTGLWKLSTANQDPDKPLEVLANFAWLLGTELTPVIEKRGLWTSFWFRSGRELDKDEVEEANSTVKINFRGQGLDIDCYRSSDTAISFILNVLGDRLTEEQLIQMVGWLEDHAEDTDIYGRTKLEKGWVAETILKIKALPNWPSDMTDWALGDW